MVAGVMVIPWLTRYVPGRAGRFAEGRYDRLARAELASVGLR